MKNDSKKTIGGGGHATHSRCAEPTAAPALLIVALIICGPLLLCSGCETFKQMAPNGWNATVYQGGYGDLKHPTVAVGVSGALPWGKQ